VELGGRAVAVTAVVVIAHFLGEPLTLAKELEAAAATLHVTAVPDKPVTVAVN
jgi:hypothetical protein